TVFDHALSRPWTVDKTFRRNPDPQPDWPEHYCQVTNHNLVLGGGAYRLNEEGILMPTRKDQPPPDLQHFALSPKRRASTAIPRGLGIRGGQSCWTEARGLESPLHSFLH